MCASHSGGNGCAAWRLRLRDLKSALNMWFDCFGVVCVEGGEGVRRVVVGC